MAVIQVMAVIYAARLGRRIEALSQQIERDVRPIFSELRAFSSDAARAMSMAAGQVERADRMLKDFSARLEQLFETVQTHVIAPIREGATLLTGIRAILRSEERRVGKECGSRR